MLYGVYMKMKQSIEMALTRYGKSLSHVTPGFSAPKFDFFSADLRTIVVVAVVAVVLLPLSIAIL